METKPQQHDTQAWGQEQENALVEIVKEAARLMQVDAFEVTRKDGWANIVTSSDVAVQQFLCERLSELLPGSGFLCEEDDVWDTTRPYTWIIDPIDGTANYARGIDQCAISVGLRHADHIIQGVVYLPRTAELFTARLGNGAYRNGQRIHVSDRPFANAVMCTALAVYHKEYAHLCSDIITDTFLQCNDIRRFGAAAPELCYLAMGRCELYFEYLLSPWDFAGASIVLTEAGGHLSDLQGRPLSCITPSGVLAANSEESLQRLCTIVHRHMTETEQNKEEASGAHTCPVSVPAQEEKPRQGLRIGVFCSSSDRMEADYYHQATRLGQWMASRGHTLVYGGCSSGLMEALAEGVKSGHGKVVGVVPQILVERGRVSRHIDEMILTSDLGQRKQGIIDGSDIIVALPGSVGTLDEVFTVLAANTIGIHDRRVLLWNIHGFWDGLMDMLQGLEQHGVANKPYAASIAQATTLEQLTQLIEEQQKEAL